MKKIAILIPTFNEEPGIKHVIDAVPLELLYEHGYSTRIVVIDNKSTDKTAQIAKSRGAEVITEPARGKGNALVTGFKYVKDTSDYVVIIDGDNTYKPQEIYRLIEPLESGFCDVIAGSRIGGKTEYGALSFSHRFVNWAFAFFVRQFYQANITDALTGFIAMKSSVVKTLIPNLKSKDFTIEMEMITKLSRLGFEVYSVPITYERRLGTSKIDSFKDGVKILGMFVRNLRWKPVQKKSRLTHIKKKITMFFSI